METMNNGETMGVLLQNCERNSLYLGPSCLLGNTSPCSDWILVLDLHLIVIQTSYPTLQALLSSIFSRDVVILFYNSCDSGNVMAISLNTMGALLQSLNAANVFCVSSRELF